MNDNWNILNRKVHGDLGSSLVKWTYDNCKEEALIMIVLYLCVIQVVHTNQL